MERVFIYDFHVNVANDMWNLGFKGSIYILIKKKKNLFDITSSCNITIVDNS